MRLRAAIGAAVLAAAIGGVVGLRSPPAAADVALGTEEAFAVGPHRRAVGGGGPVRWSGGQDTFRFRSVAPGPATLEVALGNVALPVRVAVDGVQAAVIAPGQGTVTVPLTSTGTRVEVTLLAERRPGGPPGVTVQRVALHPAGGRVDARTILLFVLPALAVCVAGLLAGVTPPVAAAIAGASTLLQAALLWPAGLVHSGWAETVALWLVVGGLLAGVFARAMERRFAGAALGALVAALATLWVQGVAATASVMVVSDVVFHANKLRQVMGGDWFPVSVTQHAHPFRIPYGVSFYALLAPLARLGLDPVALVRGGAAVAAIASTLLVFPLLARRDPRRAALAVVLLDLLPITVDVFSYGNLSNVFGQAMTVAFFCWWAGPAVGGAAMGAVLLALGSLAHLSSLIVLAVLVPALVALGDPARRRDRVRWVAVGVGFALAALYYAHFAREVLEQLPRLKEGGGTGKAPVGPLLVLWDQVRWANIRWGLPAILLAAAGFPRRPEEAVDRDLRAFWAAGAVLCVAALVSPLEVRYVYALTLPLAVAAATSAMRLWSRGTGARLAVAGLLSWQLVIAWQGIAEALWARYR